MKQLHQTRLLLLVLLTGWFAQSNVLAQTPPVILRLKGVAVGSTVNGYAIDVQVVGNLAHLAWSVGWGGDTNHQGGLEIFSVTNPAAPLRLGGYESPAPVSAIQVVGQYAYLAEGTPRTSTNDPGVLEIINVSDPANPVRTGSISTRGRGNQIRVAGDFAYVAEGTRWTGSNLLGALEIFDVSTPMYPIRVASFETAGSATSVDVSRGYAFLSDGVTDLQVLDVSDPADPRRVASYQSDVSQNLCGLEPGGPANYVQIVGNLAYSAGYNGLHVLDISDPQQPVPIGDNFCYRIDGLHVAGRYAYAAMWHSDDNTYAMYVLDALNPGNLVWVGWKGHWNSRVFQVVGNLIYMAANPLLVYEITDRPAITSLSADAESLFLTWDFAPGFVLQRTTSLHHPLWIDVPGSADRSSIALPVSNGNEFFRLVRP